MIFFKVSASYLLPFAHLFTHLEFAVVGVRVPQPILDCIAQEAKEDSSFPPKLLLLYSRTGPFACSSQRHFPPTHGRG